MTESNFGTLATRVAEIRQRITNAGGQKVKLIAVTKTFGSDAMVGAFRTGCDGVGENYAQELKSKYAEVQISDRLPVHFIGNIQRNKVKQLIKIVDVWQSVDRFSVIEEIAKASLAIKLDRTVQIMLQVNSTGESGKAGCHPDEVPQLYTKAVDLGLDVIGLMTIGPTIFDPKLTRTAFELTRNIATELGIAELSMGMSGDLEIAVEQGSTAVRIGTALFGSRN